MRHKSPSAASKENEITLNIIIIKANHLIFQFLIHAQRRKVNVAFVSKVVPSAHSYAICNASANAKGKNLFG